MKKLAIIVCTAALSGFMSSCTKVKGEGPIVTETRPVNTFTGISSGMSGHINIISGPMYKVEVTGQQNILDVLKTYVVNGVLEVHYRNNVRVKTHDDVTVNITMPSVDHLRLSGSGNVDAWGDFVTNNLEAIVSGSGNITLHHAEINGLLKANISGSGEIKIHSGSAANENLTVSGSGNIDLSGVQASQAVTHTSGSGNIRLKVTDLLDATISGSGSVFYLGNPVVHTSISGSGRVRPY